MRRKGGSQGFTLIEIMMAGAVGMVVLLGLAEMINYTARSSKATQVTSDWVSLQNTLKQAFLNYNTCDAIAQNWGLAGVDIDSSNSSANPVAITSVSYNTTYSTGVKTITLAAVNQPVNGLVINSMQMWETGTFNIPNTQPDVSSNYYSQYNVTLQINAGLATYLTPGAAGSAGTAGTGHTANFDPHLFPLFLLRGPLGPDYNPAPGFPATIQGCVQ